MSKILQDIPLERQIAKYVRQWEMRRTEWQRQTAPLLRQSARKPGPYITLSRELGSGGTEISHRLAEKLGWQHYDREIIEAIAARTHVHEQLVARFDEHIRNELDTYLYNLLTRQLLNNTEYLASLTRVLVSVAQYGNAVIVGRGANFILPPEAGLRVRVVAPLETRVQRVMQVRGHDEKRALEEIATHDRERRDFVERNFRCRPEDPCAYDAVINTGGRAGLAAATDFIVRLAEIKLAIPLTPGRYHAAGI